MSRETVVLYCTDRGQHPRAFVEEVVKVDTGAWLVARSFDSPRRKAGVRAGRKADYKGPMRRTFVCARCTRRPQLSESHWTELLDSVSLASPPELDVSFLD